MQSIPLLHIIFYLAVTFLPTGTTRLALTSGYDQKMTWVHQAGGAWQATAENGKDAGLWSVDGFVVSVTMQGKTEKTDVSSYVEVLIIPGVEKQVSVLDVPVKVSSTPPTITLSQETNGIFTKPVVITCSTNSAR
jgi:hypothetical protein